MQYLIVAADAISAYTPKQDQILQVSVQEIKPNLEPL